MLGVVVLKRELCHRFVIPQYSQPEFEAVISGVKVAMPELR